MTAIALFAPVVGCEKPTASSRPQATPAVTAGSSEPADSVAMVAAYPIRPPSMLFIDGHDVPFPAAKLAIINHAVGGITLRVCSDDPPTAIDPGYAGNSYLFDMQIPVDRVEDLPMARWDRKSSEADDSVSGIFIHGYHNPLRLGDIHVTFQKSGSELLTYITGTFLRDDNQNPGAPPKQIQVSGCLRTDFPGE